MQNLKNKTVWITGARRIGQVVAETLAKEGANIIVSYRSGSTEAEKIVKNVKKYKVKTLSLQCDVSSRESVGEAIKTISKNFKKIDILVNMASVFTPIKFEDIKEKDWQLSIDAHVLGTFWPTQAVWKIMPEGSHIINIADRTSLGKNYKGYLPYIVTKGAVSSMTKALAVELAPRGIFVNAIAPGPILRPEDITEKDWQKIRKESPLKYKVTDKIAVEQFANLVVYLSGVEMSSGYTYPLDQGQNL